MSNQQWHRVLIYDIPSNYREQDLRDLLSDFESLQRVDCKEKYGYVFFTDLRDADEAIEKLNGKVIEGKEIHLEVANSKEAKNNDPPNYGLRVRVYGLNYRTTWQDLKDWARIAGKTKYANVTNRGSQTIGVIEFLDFDSFDRAFEVLESYPLNRERVRLAKEEDEHRKDQESGFRNDNGGGYRNGRERDRDYGRDSYSRGGYSDSYSRGGGSYDNRDSRGYDSRDSRGPERSARSYGDDLRRPSESDVGGRGNYYRDERPRSRSRDRGSYPVPSSYSDNDSRRDDRYGSSGKGGRSPGRSPGRNYGRR